MNIKRITAAEALPLRQAVLWPNHPLAVSQVQGDQEAIHFGLEQDNKLICVTSLFWEGHDLRLRKFATAQDQQGKGYGSKMLQYTLTVARSLNAQNFWFDARENALPFYAKHGFEPHGPKFHKNGVAYRRVSMEL